MILDKGSLAQVKPTYPFIKKRPSMTEGLFFIPKFYPEYEEFSFPSFEKLFGNHHPVYLEFCSGNGQWICEKAKQNPEKNWIAVEKKWSRVQKIKAKREKRALSNLFIVYGEGETFTKYYLAEKSLETIFINFPDPWPKKRHAKHRLVQKEFIDLLSPALSEKGKAIFVTDDENYRDQMILTMEESLDWTRSFPFPFFITHWPEFGSSYFNELWREKGRSIYYIQYEKRVTDKL